MFARPQDGEPEYDMFDKVEQVGLMNSQKNDKIGWNNGDACTLMQYTGLKDKNGKEIYEGDVVFIRSFSPEKNIVRFNRGGFCIEPVIDFPLEANYWPDIKYAEDDNSEIIGNIYENPELLTQ